MVTVFYVTIDQAIINCCALLIEHPGVFHVKTLYNTVHTPSFLANSSDSAKCEVLCSLRMSGMLINFPIPLDCSTYSRLSSKHFVARSLPNASAIAVSKFCHSPTSFWRR